MAAWLVKFARHDGAGDYFESVAFSARTFADLNEAVQAYIRRIEAADEDDTATVIKARLIGEKVVDYDGAAVKEYAS
jgi:hypothetical protein